jgi:general secretion pathway protein C
MVSLALPQHVFRHPFRAGRISLFINIINGLLVLWLAWQLAGLSWLLLPSPPAGDTAAVASDPQPVQRKQASFNEKELASWHLFGEAGQTATKKAAPLSAPETQLRLTLKGVFASDDEALGRAIIADPKGKEDTYGVGDPLPGGAKLSEIYPDRIILERNGRFETLKLPKKRSSSAARRVSHRTASRISSNNSNRASAFNKYRNEIKQNPASFLNYVRATPARQNGKFVGFRLQPGKQRGALKDLGLKPGDIVTSINGVQIDAPAKGMKAMQALGDGDSVNVTLLRGGQEVSLNLTLPASTR